MSMNLMWEEKGKKRFQDLPFQSTTELTYAVLAEKSKEKQLKLMELFFNKRLNLKDPDDVEWGMIVIESIKEKLFNKNFTLVMM